MPKADSYKIIHKIGKISEIKGKQKLDLKIELKLRIKAMQIMLQLTIMYG